MIVPPVWNGNIQVADAAAKKQMSEYIAQKFGGNINFLKKTADDLQAQLNTFLATGPLSVVGITIAAHVTSVVSPSGNPWFACFIEQLFDTNPQPDGIKPVLFGQQTWWPNGFSALITGNTLLVDDWGHEWAGFGFYET